MVRAVYFLLPLAAGAISALGFAPLDWWPLTLAAVAVLVAVIEREPTVRGAALAGWLFGVGQFTVSLGWIATAFTYQAAMPPFMGWVTVVLLSMFLALYPGIAAGLARAWPGGRPSRILVFAAAWMLTEWLRGHVLSGFAWNPLGAAWLPAGGMALAAAWIGALGLSGLMVIAGGLVALVADRWRRESRAQWVVCRSVGRHCRLKSARAVGEPVSAPRPADRAARPPDPAKPRAGTEIRRPRRSYRKLSSIVPRRDRPRAASAVDYHLVRIGGARPRG